MKKTLSFTCQLSCLCAVLVLTGILASPTGFASPLQVTITGAAGSGQATVALGDPAGGQAGAQQLQSSIKKNLSIIPFLKVLDGGSIPGGAGTGSGKGEDIDFKRFQMAQANLLVTTNWLDASRVELRVFDVGQGKFLFGNSYTVRSGNEAIADEADRFCDDFLESLIGSRGLFTSTIAFIKSDGPRKKDVWAVKVNGRNLRKLTNIKGEALSPTWSPDGGKVLFTHIDHRSHGLGVWSGGGVQRIRFPGNTVIGPSYLPDGRVAVGLSDGRNPSIFLLGSSFQKEGRLEGSHGIDVSPSIDASGKKMAFTSSRFGGPQIFLKDLYSGSVSRVSSSGNYNTDASISPDGTAVVYTRMVGGGFRIFLQDLSTGRETQLTGGPGRDEEPAFAPDGYFVAFSSTRGGQKTLYLTTRDGGNAVRIPTGSGDAAFPDWSRAKR